ncbi:MAG: peptidoglycan-associated lipoprotein Pal, partial [Pseudomonadota bacterium]|nr:peptidoglycan-associated lipoprotein Pal [Pseudomonadota bacterium]
RVFFETDRSVLDASARGTLVQQAEWLNQNGGINMTIEGHADERGTREYNLALGARRANAVRDFLISQGVNASRLQTISFGKERPVSLCAEESCWSKNRRSVSTIR